MRSLDTRRLPLFPLGVVLFPGAPLPLHVFEPRYRQMVAHCLEADRRFGLVYHDPDRFGPFRMEPGRVGCVAEILQFQPLPDGRSLMLTRGTHRFRIDDGIESPSLYYEALADAYEDQDPPDDGIVERRRGSINLFRQVLEGLPEPPDPLPVVPEDEEVSFQLAQSIRIDPAWQQVLLEMRSEAARLDRIDTLLRAVLDER